MCPTYLIHGHKAMDPGQSVQEFSKLDGPSDRTDGIQLNGRTDGNQTMTNCDKNYDKNELFFSRNK